MKQFALKCLNCGKELIINKSIDENDFDCENIAISDDLIKESIVISCACGNKAEFI